MKNVMNLTSEEKFNQVVWWVLQEIKKEGLATSKDRCVYFEPQASDNPNLSVIDQRRALKLLEKEGAISIQDEKYPLKMMGFAAELYNWKPIGYYLNILQPKFDEIYNEFAEKFKERGRDKRLNGIDAKTYAEEMRRQLEELKEKQEEKEVLKKEIIEEIKSKEETQDNKKPFCIIEKNWGYLKFDKYGEKIKIGKPKSRHFRLLECLLEPFGKAKTIEAVYEWIKLPKDKKDSDLSGWDNYKKKGRQITIIQNTIKELQKDNKLKGKLAFEFDDTKSKIWMKSLE